MYSCCQFEDETIPEGSKTSLPQYHTVTTMPSVPQQHLVTATVNNTTAIAMVQQQQPKHHQQQQGQTYTTMLPGSPPAIGHSAMALGPSNSPLLEGPMPCSTFLPRHDRRLAVVDRWNRPKPEKVMSGGSSGGVGVGGIAGGITDLQSQQQFQQSLGTHWSLQGVVTGGVGGSGDTGLDEYKRYYGPIDPEGLGANLDQQTGGPQQTPKTNSRGFKASGIPRLPPKGPHQGQAHLISKPPPPIPSSPRRPPFWRRGSLAQTRRKGSGGPLYENILPLGRRGGGRYGASDGVGRRGHRPPPPPLPVPLSSPTHTPTTPSSPCRFYSSCSSASSSSSSSSSSTSSSSSGSLSRSNSPSSCTSDSSYNSSLSFRYRAGDRDFMVDDEYDSDLLTEESSLLLGSRKKIRSRRMSSRSLPCSPPPPPIPPRKPHPQRNYGRERTSSQLAQLQEWWASWGDREHGRGGTANKGNAALGRDEKRHHKEREHERKRRKKGRKKKKREERERERERKRRKAKKKRKKDDKIKKRERKRSELESGDPEKREEGKSEIPEFPPYPPSRRESFRKKSESSIRSYGWNIPGEERKEREENKREDVEESRGKDRHHRRRNIKHHHSSSNKPSTSVKFWGGGNPSDNIPSAFLPLLPISSKRRKSKSSDRDAVCKEGERRPLLGRNEHGEMHSKEGLSFHEWESEVEGGEEDSEPERRKADHGKRHGGSRTLSEEDRERDKVVGIYSDDDGSSGEFGKFERYWEDHEGRAVGGIGGGGWFFSTYPSRDKAGTINSRDDLFLERGERWGTAETEWGSSAVGAGSGGGDREWGSGSHWPLPPLMPPPPRRYWSVDKLHIQDEKKSKRKSKDKGRGHTACSSCQSPRHHPQYAKWARVTSRSQEELYPHCQNFGGPSKPKHDSSSSSKPERSLNPSKSGSQSNLSIPQRTQRTDRDRDRGRQPSPPSSLIPNLPSPLPALPAPPSSAHSIHVPPLTSTSSVSSPSVVSSTPGAPQASSMASASAKLQYQRLRSVPQPQRFPLSPHLPLKAKSLCSRRGSAHFSSVESEV